MITERMQWIGTPVLGLCLLLQGCAVGSSDLQYHLALDTDPAGQKSDCTVVLKSVVDDVLNGSSGPVGGSSWTIRDFQIKLERQLHQTVKGLTCNSNKKTLKRGFGQMACLLCVRGNGPGSGTAAL